MAARSSLPRTKGEISLKYLTFSPYLYMKMDKRLPLTHGNSCIGPCPFEMMAHCPSPF